MNVIWGGQGNWENWEKAICEDGPWECWSSVGDMLVYGLIKAYWATKFLSKWYQHMSPKVAYFTTKLELRPIIVVISTSFLSLYSFAFILERIIWENWGSPLNYKVAICYGEVCVR